MSAALLVLNAGSSSLKFSVYAHEPALPELLKGSISRLGDAPRLSVRCPGQPPLSRALGNGALSANDAVETALAELETRGMLQHMHAVGHRIVHGGLEYSEPLLLDALAVQRLRRLSPLAPLHQPYNLDIVEQSRQHLPQAQQIGAFDTAFHANRPAGDRLYGLPRELAEDGIVAYGFHGLSYSHVAGVLRSRAAGAGGRAIVAHLGSGASLCAMQAGHSIATTMGFSPLDGLLMSTRCGPLDPGVILHLLGERGMDLESLNQLLYRRSGLLGLSGISGDMQVLLDSADPRADEAIELFVYRIGRQIGSLSAALGGLDTLVFTAGIGENSAHIRQRVCEAAGWLGVAIDPAANAAAATVISTSDSRVEVLVVPTEEERAVAQAVLTCLARLA
ncbi:acetate kinase [soil metagenome]